MTVINNTSNHPHQADRLLRVDLSQCKVYVFVPYCIMPSPPPSSWETFSNFYRHKNTLEPVVVTTTSPTGEERTSVLQSPEYDDKDYYNLVEKWLGGVCAEWVWQPVALCTLAKVVEAIAEEQKTRECVVLNFCDGYDTVDGFPGLSVIKLLEEHRIPFSGPSSSACIATSDKALMKEKFIENYAPTAPFVKIDDNAVAECVREAASHVGFPFIVKPCKSCASLGIESDSVCRDEASAIRHIEKILQDEDIRKGGVLVEKFIAGREFTLLATAHPHLAEKVIVYPPIERRFDKSIPFASHFLTYDLHWRGVSALDPDNISKDAPFIAVYKSVPVERELHDILTDIAKQAFLSIEGCGYVRVDVRMATDENHVPLLDPITHKPEVYILESNTLCGIDDDESSVAAILQSAGKSVQDFVLHILSLAMFRNVDGLQN